MFLKRLKKRENFNKKLLKKFKNIQLPLDYKKKKSQFFIKNNFTKELDDLEDILLHKSYKMKEIILDTETTGLSVRDGHRIVEIGCIELENLIPTNNRFHCYLNPERKVSEKALEVHGYTDEFLSTHKKFAEIVDEFLAS